MELIKNTNKIKACLVRVVGENRGALLEAKPLAEYCVIMAVGKYVNLNSAFVFSGTLEPIALNFRTCKGYRARHLYGKFERTPIASLGEEWR